MFKGEKRGVSLSPDKIKNEQSSVVGYKQENPAQKTGKKTSLNSKDIGAREQTAGCIHILESSINKGDSRFGDIPCPVNLKTTNDREKSPKKGSSSRFFSNSTRSEEFSSLPNKKQNSRDECSTNVSPQRESADRLVLNQRNDTSPKSTKRLSSVKCFKAEIFVGDKNKGDNPNSFGKRQSADTLKSIHREFSPVLNREQSPDKFQSSRTVTSRDVLTNGSRKQSPDKSLNRSPQGSNSPELKKKQSVDRGKKKEALPEVVIKPGPDKVYSVKIEIAKDCSKSLDELGKGGIKEVSSEFSKKHSSTNNVHGTGKVHSKELEQKHPLAQITDTKNISKVTEKQLPEKVCTQKVEKSSKKFTGKEPIVESSQIKEVELQTKQLSEKKLGKKYPDKNTTKVTGREQANTRQQEDICVDVFFSDSEITGDPLIQTVFVSPESTRTDLHSPTSMERIGRLINEANEISQYLRKDYVFAKCDDDLENNENSLLVKVISKNLGVSCSWSATELKEKLVQMRKFMYEELSEDSSKNVDLFLLNSSSNANGEGNNQVNKSERNTNSANTRDKDRQSVVKSSHQSPSPRSPASANVATVKVASANVATVKVESANVATVKVESANVATVKVESANVATVKDVSPVKVASMNGVLPNVKSAQVTSSNVTSCPPDFPTSVIKEASSCSSFSSAMSYSSGNQNGKLSRSHSTECGGLPEKYLTGSVVPGSSDSVFVPKSTQRWSPRTVMSPWGKQILPTNRHHPIKTLQLKSSSSSKSDDSGEHTPRETYEKPAEEFKCSSDFSIYKLCKDLTSMTLLRFTENSWQIELLDRILGAIEGIRQGVERVQKIYAGDRKNEKLNLTGRSSLGSSTSIAQVSICLEILQTTVSILCLKTHNPGDIELAGAHENLLKVSKEITKQMIVLWQSCEIQADDSICDSISSVHRNLLLLATECGKLAAVLNTCPALLSSNSGDMATEGPTDDLLTLLPSFEVKLSFICGCDNIVNKMLHDSQDALVKRQEYLQSLCTLCQDSSNAEDKQEILLNVYRVTAACRTVLILLQKIQGEVNSTMKININRPTTYLSDLFQSGIFIMNEIQTLVDNSELLIRASVPLHTDFDSGTLKKIVRCADLVQRSNEKLARACNVPSANSPVTELSRTSSDEPSIHCKYTAILSRSQATTLRQTLEATRQAAQVLMDVVELKMTINDLADTGKVKRLLPVTPHGNLLRCKSASSSHSINSRSSTYRSNFTNRSSTVTTEL